MNQTKRETLMGHEKMKRLLPQMAIPAIIGMMVTAIYNIVDTIFIGKLGTSAIGASSVAYPLFMLIAAVGLTFGIGAGSYISRLLGQKDHITAEKTAMTAIVTSLLSGLGFTFLGLAYLPAILKLFGATPSILPFAMDYSRVLLMGSVFTMLNMTFNNILRAEGSAKFSMVALLTGAILNIILDPIFIFVLDMGIRGAAIATVISQMTSTFLLFTYFKSGRSLLKLHVKRFTPSLSIYKEIMAIGIPTFSRQVLTSVSMGLVNVAAMPFGDPAVAAVGINARVFSLGVMIIFGYGQGFQPVVGYNYGANKIKRVNEAIKLSLKWTGVFCMGLAILSFAFAPQIVSVFSSDPEVIRLGTKAMRAMYVMFPFFGYQTIYATLYQALGRGGEAFVLSILRQGLFLIPAVLLLPNLFGFNGVLAAQPVADVLTVLLTVYFAHKIKCELNDSKESIKEVA